MIKTENDKLVGKIFSTKNCGDLEIIKYVKYREVHIRFLSSGYETVTTLNNIIVGNVKDRLSPSVFGVGVIGEKPVRNNGVRDKEYGLWVQMLRRCYSENDKVKYKTYQDCEVSEYFLKYQNFKSWCSRQKYFGVDGYELDKDVIVKGCRVYSEETCSFIPHEINTLLLKRGSKRGSLPIGVQIKKPYGRFSAQLGVNGVNKHVGYFDSPYEAFIAYKKAKELQVKEVARRWKDRVDERVYNALMAYEVEITD